jgi:hypothetical protein
MADLPGSERLLLFFSPRGIDMYQRSVTSQLVHGPNRHSRMAQFSRVLVTELFPRKRLRPSAVASTWARFPSAGAKYTFSCCKFSSISQSGSDTI